MGPGAWLGLFGPPVLLGAALARILGFRYHRDPFAWAGLVWIAGHFGTAFVLFVWLLAGGRARAPLGPDLAAVALALGLFAARAPASVARPFRAGPLFRLAFALGLLACAHYVLAGTLRPVAVDDEATIWALKAKVIHHAGGFGAAFRREMAEPGFVNQKDYPLFVPLLILRVYAHAGGIVHVASRLPVQLFAPAIFCLLAGALARCARPAAALLLLSPVLVWRFEALAGAGSGEGPLIAGLTTCLYAAVLARAREPGAPALAALGAAVALWSKNEALLYLLALAAALAACFAAARLRGPVRLPLRLRALAWLVLPAAFALLGAAFNRAFGFESPWARHPQGTLGQLFVRQLPTHLWPVLGYYADRILLAPAHALLLPAAALLLPFLDPAGRRADPWLRILQAFLFFALLGQVCVFVATPAELSWHLETAAGRIAFQLVPVAVAVMALMLDRPGPRTDAADPPPRA